MLVKKYNFFYALKMYFYKNSLQNRRLCDPKLQPQISCSLDLNKLLSVTLLCWPGSHQIFLRLHPLLPPDTSHFLIKSKECLGDLCSTWREDRQREVMFLSICHADATPGPAAVLPYTRSLGKRTAKKKTFRKEPPAWPASPRPFPPRLSVSLPL